MPRRPVVPLLLLLPVLLPAGCRQAVVPLHAMAAFSGTVRIEVEGEGGARVLDGELLFERVSRNLQWVVRHDAHSTVSLLRKDNGEVEAFANGVPRPATAPEIADFALVRSLVEPPLGPETAIRTLAAGAYEIEVSGRKARVSRIETLVPHGHR